MTLDIRPDPGHPRGGFAIFEMEELDAGAAVSVVVKNVFSGQFLGPRGWQPTRHEFGPYTASSAGGGAQIVVGPEIVDHIKEYTPLQIDIGDLSEQTSWPDDVDASPDAGLGGGLQTVSASPAVKAKPVLKAAQQKTDDAADAAAMVAVAPPPETTAAEPGGSGGKRAAILGGGLLLLAAAAAALWFFVLRQEPVAEIPAPPPVPVPAPPPTPSPCGSDALQEAAGKSFQSVLDLFGECGSQISADDALGVIKTAADAGVPEALMLFGKLYDANATDPLVETKVGVTFPTDDALAAQYYDRAAKAGSEPATTLLAETCGRLATSVSALDQAARDDHCR